MESITPPYARSTHWSLLPERQEQLSDDSTIEEIYIYVDNIIEEAKNTQDELRYEDAIENARALLRLHFVDLHAISQDIETDITGGTYQLTKKECYEIIGEEIVNIFRLKLRCETARLEIEWHRLAHQLYNSPNAETAHKMQRIKAEAYQLYGEAIAHLNEEQNRRLYFGPIKVGLLQEATILGLLARDIHTPNIAFPSGHKDDKNEIDGRLYYINSQGVTNEPYQSKTKAGKRYRPYLGSPTLVTGIDTANLRVVKLEENHSSTQTTWQSATAIMVETSVTTDEQMAEAHQHLDATLQADTVVQWLANLGASYTPQS